MQLQGQVALVVGGASGICLAIARELLREGVNVAVCDIAETGHQVVKRLQQSFGADRVIFARADVCSDADMEGAFNATRKHFQKLDIVINGAGVLDDWNWDREIDINLKGVIRGTLLAWRHMGKDAGGHGGTVVNVASQLGLQEIASVPIYAATKHAVVGLSRCCGMEFHLNRTGVRVLTLCPGLTDTPLAAPRAEPRQLSEDMAEEYDRETATFAGQTAEHVAKSLLHVFHHGTSGSVWLSEGGQPVFELAFPHRQDMRADS